MNTSGGLTDGDTIDVKLRWDANTCGVVTTQAAERLHRARTGSAQLDTGIVAGDNATACWLPQETIMFNGARLCRRIDVRLRESSRLLAVESLVFGRLAMGESVHAGALDDTWRVSVDERLVFADRLRISGNAGAGIESQLDRAAVMNGSRAFATLIYAGGDAATHLDALRRSLDAAPVAGGVSDLGPLLVARLLAPTGQMLRDALVRIIRQLGPALDVSLPRVWQY